MGIASNNIDINLYAKVTRSLGNNNNNNNNNNNDLFIYNALFNMLGDQKRITTINNLKTINTNIRNIKTYLLSKRY